MTNDRSTPPVRPLFLLSLPRAGSTLVQRVLGAHPKISTAAEPWILLPLIYARRWDGARAEYSHQLASQAIEDFALALRGGAETFEGRIRSFVEELYRDASEDGAVYFLDKTPRYHFIADDLLRVFPDGKFLFLWRNPLSVVASMLTTFRENQFDPYAMPELFGGPAALASAFDANRERAHAVQFEDLLGESREEHWRRIFDYLELDWDPRVLQRFGAVRFEGRFGDPTGVQRYSNLSTEPLDKWKASFRGPVRQLWMDSWLKRLGPRPLEIMGYDQQRLLLDVRTAGPARPDEVGVDVILLIESRMRRMSQTLALRVKDYAPLSTMTKLVRRVRRVIRAVGVGLARLRGQSRKRAQV